MRPAATMVLLGLLCVPAGTAERPRQAQISASVEPDVRVGWVSGLALLMDVYQPAPRSGHGIVLIPGSAWRPGTAEDTPHTEQVAAAGPVYLNHLLAAGYTVFVPNVRMPPAFGRAEALADLQRAVGFIRQSASRWAIDPARLGAFGASSGGHLAASLGTLDAGGSARVQAVVAMAASFDGSRADGAPLTQVSAGDAPMLIIHGEVDDVVPVSQAEWMEQARLKAGIVARFIRVAGAGHGGPVMDARHPELMAQVVAWFDRHLRGR